MQIPESVEINKRYFEVLTVLVEKRKIKSIRSFFDNHGINSGHIFNVKTTPDKKGLQPGYLTWLVLEHRVSAKWLLTGEGDMFD